MRAGSLDRRITIQRRSETISESGAAAATWSTLAMVHAELVQRSLAEEIAGHGIAEAGAVMFRIRFYPGLTTEDRIAFDGRSYDIKEIVEIGRRIAMEVKATATR